MEKTLRKSLGYKCKHLDKYVLIRKNKWGKMSHSIKVKLIADHEIELLGNIVNIHDLKTIMLNSYGKIIAYAKHDSEWIQLLENEKYIR